MGPLQSSVLELSILVWLNIAKYFALRSSVVVKSVLRYATFQRGSLPFVWNPFS